SRPVAGTALVFAVSGATQASIMSRLPAVRNQLGAGLTSLGVALVALAVGTLLAMATTGRTCRRFGTRRVVTVAATVTCVALAAVGAVRSPAGLTVVFLVFGLGTGAWDA